MKVKIVYLNKITERTLQITDRAFTENLDPFDAALLARLTLPGLDDQHAVAGEVGRDTLRARRHCKLPGEEAQSNMPTFLCSLLMLSLHSEDTVDIAHFQLVRAVVGGVQAHLQLLLVLL